MADGRAAQALQRVDLLGHAHSAELGGVARADAASQDQPGEHGAELQDHRFDDYAARDVQGQLARELIAGLQAGHGAGEARDEQDDEQATVAGIDGLIDHAWQPDTPLGEAAHHVEDEETEAAGVARRAEAPAPDVAT